MHLYYHYTKFEAYKNSYLHQIVRLHWNNFQKHVVIYYFIREYDVSALSYILKIPYVDCQKVYVEKNTGCSFTGEELISTAIRVAKGMFLPV